MIERPTPSRAATVRALLPNATGRRRRVTVHAGDGWKADFLIGGKGKPQQVSGWVKRDTPREY